MDPKVIPFPAKSYRVLIVEDQTAIREMLALLVASLPGFEIVGQAGTIEEAKRLAGDLDPDVVVLDWMFPEGTGAEFLAELRREARQTEVLVFSATTSAHAVREALTGGAKGFVEKGASMAELTKALQAVAAGGIYFGPAVARRVDALVRPRPEVATNLSERELEVLNLIANGLPSKEIAVQLKVSVKTVNAHRASISAKTGFTSIARLTMHAARLGLIPGPHDSVDASGAPRAVGPEAHKSSARASFGA